MLVRNCTTVQLFQRDAITASNLGWKMCESQNRYAWPLTKCRKGKNMYNLLWIITVIIYIYRVSQEECARLREGVPYVKVYRYNPTHLCPKLNGYGDNGQRKVWSSGGSTHCTCQLTSLIDVYPWVWCLITESQLTLVYSRLIPECAVSHVTSVLAFMCHV